MQGIADLDVHLPGLVHLPGNFRDTAAAITGFGEILLAFKSHTAAYGQGNTVLLNPHMVSRGLVNGKILPVFGIELFHRRKKLLLGKRVIFVRHTDIPENITVTGFRDKFAAGELRVIIIGPYRNNLELTGGTVEIHLEIVVLTLPQSGKVTVLERYTFGLVGQLVIVRIEVQAVVPEIIDRERVAVVIFHIFAAHTADSPDPAGINAAEGVLLVTVIDAVLLRMYLDILPAPRKHQAAMPVF